MVKFHNTTICILVVKGLFTPVNAVLGREPEWVNMEKFTAVRQSVDGMWQLLQEAYT